MADYKIKDLEQLTGIKAHTIRVWEKRYGILNPERTDTQIRTYCDKELVSLLNVALLNNSGVKISRIAELSEKEILEKVDSLRGGYSVDSSYEKLVISLIEMDEHLFRLTLRNLVDQHGLEVAFTSHLIPFLEKIGVMWLVGSINASQEHFMSNLIRQVIIVETDKIHIPLVKEKPVMLFLPEHEWHEISLLFYQFIVRKMGISTFYLGQSLPYDALLESIDKINPSCLVTSWLTSVDGGFVKKYFQRLHADTNGLKVYAGGHQMKVHGELITNWAMTLESIEDLKKFMVTV
jgi:DNA-binding transcriptional MerR regulator